MTGLETIGVLLMATGGTVAFLIFSILFFVLWNIVRDIAPGKVR